MRIKVSVTAYENPYSYSELTSQDLTLDGSGSILASMCEGSGVALAQMMYAVLHEAMGILTTQAEATE